MNKKLNEKEMIQRNNKKKSETHSISQFWVWTFKLKKRGVGGRERSKGVKGSKWFCVPFSFYLFFFFFQCFVLNKNVSHEYEEGGNFNSQTFFSLLLLLFLVLFPFLSPPFFWRRKREKKNIYIYISRVLYNRGLWVNLLLPL